MTMMPNAQLLFRSRRHAPATETARESRAVEMKCQLPSPTPRLALPAPTATAALAAVTARAGMTVDDLARASARPSALAGAAIEQRFRYWYGRSGRRYLFSEIGPTEVADLEGVVVLIPGRDADRPDYVGADATGYAGHGPVFVHLLADTEADRAAVVADLAPRAA